MSSQNKEEEQFDSLRKQDKEDLELLNNDFINISTSHKIREETDSVSTSNDFYQQTISRSDSLGRPKKNKAVKEIVDWVLTLSLAVALAMIIRTYLFAIFVVDGESMYPTMGDSEWLVVNKAIYYLEEPDRGDIVVFHASETRDYIKRVIALGGDTFEIVSGKVYVNDILLTEDYINEEMIINNNYPKITIPEGRLFVLGDNRNRSADSRMHEVGYVDLNEVVGRAEFVFWPMKEAKKIK